MACPREAFLFVWFYKQQGRSVRDACSGAIVNVLVTQVDPPFCHVELAFEDGDQRHEESQGEHAAAHLRPPVLHMHQDPGVV